MNKLLLFISAILILGVSLVNLVSLVSASHFDYFGSGYGSDYYTADRATVPIFKGPYGNYRYQGYASGDIRPNYFFRNYGYGGYSGYGYGGSYGYPSYGVGFGYGGFGYGYGPYYTNYRPGPYFRSYLF